MAGHFFSEATKGDFFGFVLFGLFFANSQNKVLFVSIGLYVFFSGEFSDFGLNKIGFQFLSYFFLGGGGGMFLQLIHVRTTEAPSLAKIIGPYRHPLCLGKFGKAHRKIMAENFWCSLGPLSEVFRVLSQKHLTFR